MIFFLSFNEENGTDNIFENDLCLNLLLLMSPSAVGRLVGRPVGLSVGRFFIIS